MMNGCFYEKSFGNDLKKITLHIKTNSLIGRDYEKIVIGVGIVINEYLCMPK